MCQIITYSIFHGLQLPWAKLSLSLRQVVVWLWMARTCRLSLSLASLQSLCRKQGNLSFLLENSQAGLTSTRQQHGCSRSCTVAETLYAGLIRCQVHQRRVHTHALIQSHMCTHGQPQTGHSCKWDPGSQRDVFAFTFTNTRIDTVTHMHTHTQSQGKWSSEAAAGISFGWNETGWFPDISERNRERWEREMRLEESY